MSLDEDRLDGQPEDALVGTLFAGCYEIVSVLGRGGMSVVYKALHVPLNQLVAVKVMHTHVNDGAALQRLKREAQLISTLDHPSILRVLRLQVSDDGYPYLVADLVEGRTIQRVVQEDGPFDEQTFMHVFAQVLDALEHAHSRNVVHRDVKPSNLMLMPTEGGGVQVKVVDFGISKLLIDSAGGAQDVSRATSSFFGTPAYMSPEQCAGRSADCRSDIYSLACVMYEALTGVPAVTGETALDIMYHQVHDTPRPFHDVRPELRLSPQIEQAIFIALRKSRNDRPQSIHEFRTMLSGKLPVERAIHHGRMRRLSRTAIVVCTVVVLMMAIVLGVPLMMVMTTDSSADDGSPEKETSPARTVAPRLPSTSEQCFREGDRAEGRQDYDMAIKCFLRADELTRSEKPSRLTSQFYFMLKMHLASAFRGKKDLATAQRYFEESNALLKLADNSGVGLYWRERSGFEVEKGQYKAALEYAKKGVDAYELAFRTSPYEQQRVDLVGAHKRLAYAYTALGMAKESEDTWNSAINLSDALDWAVPKLETRRELAESLLVRKRFSDAKKVMDDYMDILQNAPKEHLQSSVEPMYGNLLYGRLVATCVNSQAAQPYLSNAVQFARKRSNITLGNWNRYLAEMLAQQTVNLYDCNQIAAADQASKECQDCWSKADFTQNREPSLHAIAQARTKALERAHLQSASQTTSKPGR